MFVSSRNYSRLTSSNSANTLLGIDLFLIKSLDVAVFRFIEISSDTKSSKPNPEIILLLTDSTPLGESKSFFRLPMSLFEEIILFDKDEFLAGVFCLRLVLTRSYEF
jgi:hypothetical protein